MADQIAREKKLVPVPTYHQVYEFVRSISQETSVKDARSGLKQVILPDQNRPDWMEVPVEVRQKLKAHFVKNISEMIPLALSPK